MIQLGDRQVSSNAEALDGGRGHVELALPHLWDGHCHLLDHQLGRLDQLPLLE